MEQTKIDGRYAVGRTLGSGGMANVYLAHDEVLGRDVALKVLRDLYADDEEFVERFKREARSAASLSHPNIVAIYDRGRTGTGSYYIAMEFVPGGTLKDRIVRDGAIGPEAAAGVAEQVADALSAAHERGVIHRDIKPQNVLVTRSGDVKVTDFGIARAASGALTATSAVMGTAAYMSPEQALGERVGPASDLYSLGVVLFEMLTGTLPYQADGHPVALAMKHVNEPPRSPAEVNPDVPEALDEITFRLLSKKPEDRYPNASALADDLGRARSGRRPLAGGAEQTRVMTTPLAASPQGTARKTAVQPPVAAPAHQERRRGRFLPALLALLLAVALIAGAAWTLTDGFDWNLTDNFDPTRSGAQNEQPAAQEIQVPDVTGQEETAATQQLQNAGFEVVAERRASDWDQLNLVVGQSPTGDETALAGSTVNLSIGDGPSVVTVPDLVWGSDAAATLEYEGLTLGSVTSEWSDMVPAGQVIRTDPAAGSQAARGAPVDVIVSDGPAPTPTPDPNAGVPNAGASQPTPGGQQPAAPAQQQPPAQNNQNGNGGNGGGNNGGNGGGDDDGGNDGNNEGGDEGGGDEGGGDG